MLENIFQTNLQTILYLLFSLYDYSYTKPDNNIYNKGKTKSKQTKA